VKCLLDCFVSLIMVWLLSLMFSIVFIILGMENCLLDCMDISSGCLGLLKFRFCSFLMWWSFECIVLSIFLGSLLVVMYVW